MWTFQNIFLELDRIKKYFENENTNFQEESS